MNMQTDVQSDREQISCLMDGELDAGQLEAALQAMTQPQARECWHLYHLIGDALRSPDLVNGQGDALSARRLCERLPAQADDVEPPVSRVTSPARSAANDGAYRWRMAAIAASFAAVGAVGWGLLGGLASAPPAALQVSQGSANPAVVAQAAPGARAIGIGPPDQTPITMLRDPELDQMLQAHRQAASRSAFGDTTDFLRNATFEGVSR